MTDSTHTQADEQPATNGNGVALEATNGVAVDALPPAQPPIVVDISGLTFGDLVILERLEQGQAGALPVADMLAFLNRIVVGGVNDIPVTRAKDIMRAVQAAVKESQNPNG